MKYHMEKPNRFLLYLGALLIIAMVGVGIWSIVAKSKFWTIVLVILAILLAVSGVTTLILSNKDKNK